MNILGKFLCKPFISFPHTPTSGVVSFFFVFEEREKPIGMEGRTGESTRWAPNLSIVPYRSMLVPFWCCNNYYKFRSLKQHIFFFYFAILKSKVHQQDCIPSGGSAKKLLPCLFQHFEATCLLWLMVPSSIFKASKPASSNLFSISSALDLTHLSFSLLPPSYHKPTITFGVPRQSKIIFPCQEL